eukprot:3560620-Pleurochrysis_carterae.AAC.1
MCCSLAVHSKPLSPSPPARPMKRNSHSEFLQLSAHLALLSEPSLRLNERHSVSPGHLAPAASLAALT